MTPNNEQESKTHKNDVDEFLKPRVDEVNGIITTVDIHGNYRHRLITPASKLSDMLKGMKNDK